MLRKIEDTLGNLMDGAPATRGNPMEAEARYYFNFYLSNTAFSFETFLAALSQALRDRLPNIDITLGWLRDCDRTGRIDTARRAVKGLRLAARQNLNKGAGFWERHWNLTEILIRNFDLSYADAGLTHAELADLTREFLRDEGRAQVEALRTYLAQGKMFQARKAFLRLDALLSGTPPSIADFRHEQSACYTAKGAYAAYSNALAAHHIDPSEIGWSLQEHDWCARQVFPKGRPEGQEATKSEIEPTAPAAAITAETLIPVSPPSKNYHNAIENACVGPSEASSAGVPAFVAKMMENAKRQIPVALTPVPASAAPLPA